MTAGSSVSPTLPGKLKSGGTNTMGYDRIPPWGVYPPGRLNN
jgi:hypothetical protein